MHSREGRQDLGGRQVSSASTPSPTVYLPHTLLLTLASPHFCGQELSASDLTSLLWGYSVLLARHQQLSRGHDDSNSPPHSPTPSSSQGGLGEQQPPLSTPLISSSSSSSPTPGPGGMAPPPARHAVPPGRANVPPPSRTAPGASTGNSPLEQGLQLVDDLCMIMAHRWAAFPVRKCGEV